MSLSIGAVPLLIQCEDESYLELIRHRYEGFLSDSSEDLTSAYTFQITVQDELLPGSEVTPTVEPQPGGYEIHRRDFQVVLSPEARTVVGTVARSMYSFDSMLRVVFTLLLNDLDGLLVHGSSIVEGGNAYLFYGVSGSGKTTTTLLSAPRVILSDELTLVRREGDGYYAYGTPFWGELQKNGENVRAPLKAVLLLKKDPDVFVEAQTPRQALRTLLPCVLFFAREPNLVNGVVERAIHLVESVETGALHFRKDDAFWKVLGQD